MALATLLHGRGGMLYLASGAASQAIKIGAATKWNVKIDRKLDDANVLGDVWQTKLEGIRPWSGSIEGKLDTSDPTVFNASIASGAVKFYFYPSGTNSANFYSGTCWPALNVTDDIGAVESYTCDFTGDGTLAIT